MAEILSAFSIEHVSRLTGLSKSQLANWDRDDFFAPSLGYENRRSPYSRIYTFEDVVGLRTLAILRERVSLQHLKRAAIRLRQHSGKPWSELTFYVLNREVHFRRPDTSEVEGAVSGQKALAIPLESVAEDMLKKADRLRARKRGSIGKFEKRRFVMGGSRTFAGTRITIDSVISFADAGYTIPQILELYPELRRKDLEAALLDRDGERAA